jgi:hypothetical protein
MNSTEKAQQMDVDKTHAYNLAGKLLSEGSVLDLHKNLADFIYKAIKENQRLKSFNKPNQLNQRRYNDETNSIYQKMKNYC